MGDHTVERESHDRLFGRVRGIRTDARALIPVLDELASIAKLNLEAAPGEALQASLKSSHEGFRSKGFPDHIAALRTLEAEHPDLEIYGDRFGAIRNGLESAQAGWPAESSKTVSAINASINKTKADLEAVIFECCRLTIPDDVDRVLAGIGIGRSLDFEGFKGELPDQAKRTQILSELSMLPISGWVDLKAGLIYKKSPNRAVRICTYFAPLLTAAAAIGLLIGIANLGHLGLSLPQGWHLSDAHQLVGAFLLVLAGAIIHLVIENVKQLQMRSVPILAIGNTLDWLHLRWVGVSLTVVPIVIAVIGLRMLGTESDGSNIPLYIAAGYSLDSVAGLFLTRFDSSASAILDRLTKQLKGADGAPAPAADG
jgi:hypothetical protein